MAIFQFLTIDFYSLIKYFISLINGEQIKVTCNIFDT